jgi:hypothetical protein
MFVVISYLPENKEYKISIYACSEFKPLNCTLELKRPLLACCRYTSVGANKIVLYAQAKFNNSILKRIASGNLYVVNDINKDNVNITEYILYKGTFTPLLVASENGHTEVIKRLLTKNCDGSYEFPGVNQNIRACVSFALSKAFKNGHYEIAYIFGWPNGVKDIPQSLNECIPVIRQGEIMVNERDAEATQLFRWLYTNLQRRTLSTSKTFI